MVTASHAWTHAPTSAGLCDPSCGKRSEDLLVATARGATELQSYLSSTVAKNLLSQKDEFGFSSLTVATYLGDYVAAELLLKEGAVIVPGDITAFMGDAPVKLSSVVELAVRRSSMLIMLGTGRET